MATSTRQMNLLRFSRRFFYIAGAVIVAMLLTIIIVLATGIGRATLHVGEVAPATLRAPKSIVYHSIIKTKQAQALQASKVAPVYLDKSVLLGQQQQRVSDYFSAVTAARQDGGSAVADKIAAIKPVELTVAQGASIAQLSAAQWTQLQGAVQAALNSLQTSRIDSPIAQSDYNRLDQLVDSQYVAAGLPVSAQTAAEQIAQGLLVANHVVDGAETQARRAQAESNVGEILIAIQQGEILTLRGQVIDAFTLEELQAVGLAKPQFNLQTTLAIFLLSLSLLGALSLYFYTFIRDVKRRKDYLMLAGGLVLLTIAAIVLLPLKPTIAYIFPVPAFGVLTALLIDTESGILISVIGAMLCGYLAGQSFEIAFIQCIASIAAVLLSRNIARISAFGQVAAGTFVAVALSGIGFLLLSGDFSLHLAGSLLLSAVANGILSVLLVIGGMIVIGRYLEVPSFLQFMELENPSHPLLRQLVLKAPGTYQHSLVIANMAERAASAIGADPLLARTAAYYHDIGKVNDPAWFVENQHGVNPHDKLNDPLKSAQKIIAHVPDGLELARQHHLPEPVQHIILSHHGTTRVEYFYQLARKKNSSIDPGRFTYPGPLPRTKEAGIIMIADGVEARARSLSEQSADSLQQTVQFIIDERKADGQLADSGLTYAELQQTSQAFVEVLSSVYQHRIKYPGQR